ncbi:MAG: hypothetical protein LBK28_09275 [Propionibacteriaceae bacterium]|nr:hypothetical protein [Propionibacteriaceae bacterium]
MVRAFGKSWGIVLLAVALAGCSTAYWEIGNDRSGDNIAEEIENYSNATKELTLPPDASWPSSGTVFDFVLNDPEPHHLQEGYGSMRAQELWHCAWQFEAVETKDKSRKSKALETLELFKDMKVYKDSDSSFTNHVDDILAKAKLGDFSPMAENTANCMRTWIYPNPTETKPPK